MNLVNGSLWWPSWLWRYGSCIYNYRCNQYMSLLIMWVRISIIVRCTTLCDKICQWLAKGRWISPGPPVSSTNNTGRHDITEILLKVAFDTITQTKKQTICVMITNDRYYCVFKMKGASNSTFLHYCFCLFVIRMSNTEEHTSNLFLWNANRYLNLVLSKHTGSMGYHYNLHLLIPHVRSL